MRALAIALLAVCLVATGSVPALAAPAADVSVGSVTYSGDGAVGAGGNATLLWGSASHEFTAEVATESGVDGEVCLVAVPAGSMGGVELRCRPLELPADTTESVAVSASELPANLTGDVTVRVLVRSSEGAVLGADQTAVTVLRREADPDGDGLSNEREVSARTDPLTADTDGDGLSDGDELRVYGTSPTSADTDADGLDDDAEVEVHGTDPTVADTDGDSLQDAREVALGTSPNRADTDGDGLADGAEVNVHETDPLAPDSDEDGVDDGAEVTDHGTNPLQADTDDDGLDDGLEVHTYDTDPNRADTDGDGLADGAEVFEHQTDPATADTDGDGLEDGAEVNAHGTYPNRADSDGDGLTDGAEVNRFGTDPLDVDTDDDGDSDAAEVDTGNGGLDPGPVGAIGALVLMAALGWVYRSDYGVALREWVPVGDAPGTATDGTDAATERDDGADAPDGTAATGPSDLTAVASGVDASEATATDDGPTPPGGADSTGAADATGDRTTTDAGEGSGAPTDADSSTTADAPARETAGVSNEDLPPELLPNEERVHRLLEAHGGRIQQSEIVTETGWSKSKVSRVLSEMAAEDEVVKLTVGAGNVIMHPEEAPPGAADEGE